ncbi:MAG: HlyD family efflux transporter periplasmic adaptor subunit [Methylacidiphilales bacterium]|nr:HlyD family efflux transporter periplasmic adaptor subunit [Candidatus Methylacidiphilales bacterium]
MTIETRFDQPILLQQSPTWSRLIAWGIFSITAFTIIWASVFQIEESIPTTGKLEPKSTVQEVQPPIAGVVRKIHVKEGKIVKKGEILISLEETTSQAQLEALKQTRAGLLQQKNALQQETEFYRDRVQSNTSPEVIIQKTNLLKIKPELAFLMRSRATYISENQLYRTQLNGSSSNNLTSEQKLRLQNRQIDLSSRMEDAKLATGKVKQELLQIDSQLVSANELLTINQGILNRFKPLAQTGAISQIQYLKQQQDVSTKLAEVSRLNQEKQKLQLEMNQSTEKLRNTAAVSQEDLFSRITTNEKSIAEIDTQLSKVILENQKRIYELNSQISEIDSKQIQARETLKYQKITAPVEGKIFDLKAKSPGFVTNASEPILKIVPTDNLVAKVYITNRDIGFVREGQKVDVRIDSFPFQEYGDVKGELISIGSDALPPDQVYPYWRFPAKVRLDGQALVISNRQVSLQSGMSINANIKLRKRTIMSIFTDFIIKKTESLKFVR